jgi:hypothetical protein
MAEGRSFESVQVGKRLKGGWLRSGSGVVMAGYFEG